MALLIWLARSVRCSSSMIRARISASVVSATLLALHFDPRPRLLLFPLPHSAVGEGEGEGSDALQRRPPVAVRRPHLRANGAGVRFHPPAPLPPRLLTLILPGPRTLAPGR